MRILLAAVATALVASLASPALALDLNGYRAQHRMPRLAYSSHLAGIAHEQARLMAGRGEIDHKDFIRRIGFAGGTHAENVLVGCASQDCAIRTWAKSAGHRRNMLRGDVSHYGIASVKSDTGRRYWALELGGE
jgi:uncharacterized protein YkwD